VVNYSTGIQFASGITNFTMGGLSGAANFAMTNRGNAALALTVGNSNQSASYTGILSGSGASLTKIGTGTQTLSGSNSYSGGTTINGGQLSLGNASALGASTNSLTNNGRVNLGGNSISVGSLDGNASGVVTNGTAGSTTLTVGSNNSNSTYAGTIVAGTGAIALTKTGTGTLTLTGNNSYTGGSTINGGALSITTNRAIGTGAVAMSAGTLFQYSGGAATVANNFTVTGGTGTIQNTGGGLLTLSGTLTKQGSILQFYGGSYNVTGQITGNSGSFDSDLILSNADVTLSQAATYNGPTKLMAGSSLTAGINNALPSSSILTFGDGSDSSSVTNSYNLNGNNQNLAGLLSLGGADNRLFNNSGTLSMLTLTGSSSYAGSILGNIELNLTGGTQNIIGGQNTFTGPTTVNGATLNLGAAGSLSSTASVIVQNGGTLLLGASNQVNTSAPLSLAGTLSMGGNGLTRAVAQTFSTLTLTANSVIDFSNLSGTSMLTFGSIIQGGNLLSIWNYSSGVTQLFDSAGSSDAGIDLSKISFYSDGGNTLLGTALFSGTEIVPVPEPGVLIAACLLLGWLLATKVKANRTLILARIRRRAA
jgi:autotransporter-associated beta strand protein